MKYILTHHTLFSCQTVEKTAGNLYPLQDSPFKDFVRKYHGYIGFSRANCFERDPLFLLARYMMILKWVPT